MTFAHQFAHAESVVYNQWGGDNWINHFSTPQAACDAWGIATNSGSYVAGETGPGVDSVGCIGARPILVYSVGVCLSGAAKVSSTQCADPTKPPPPPPPAPDPACKPEPRSPNGCTSDPAKASAEKREGPPSYCPKGNPIDHGTGNKLQLESDYLGVGSVGLRLQRTYNSIGHRNGRYGARWTGNYERMVLTNPAFPNNASVRRGNGKAFNFVLNNGSYQPDGDITDRLTRQADSAGNATGWQYQVAADQSLESYDADGKLIGIKSRAGLVQTLSYSDATTPAAIAPQLGLLIRVTDTFGHQLNFVYDSSSRVVQMTDPAGGIIAYSYDSANHPSTVTYPDGKVRTYVYNEPVYTQGADLWNGLTGIVDENGVRFATFNFDSNGNAISTEHAGGVEKYSITYPQLGSQSTVTDPLGNVRTYNFQTIQNTLRYTGESQPGGAGCGAAASNVSYDANGNVASRTDFNGAVTTYSYDLARNLETSRVEAAGTPQARTISTQWHASFSLPLKIAEPKRVTTYAYDASGNLLSKTEQATSDATGAQGLTPTVTGTARTWSYTYNNLGQLLTATGPRTDVVDKTTYVYDSNGNLSTITNAVGQVTTLSNYDANGRVGSIADANGVTTALTYSPRGWLTGKSVTANGTTESTSYRYDGVGQLTQVTLPNASTVSYSYDPAHRLTKIADSVGNSIVYTLDNIGNRISEQVKDPSGALARQTSRVIDALNRIQQITGAAQ
ncbi:DUF6531 domain-containing protein [Paraherbaspirillum soli]|uniref:DUF6531 domain-containing protein n=1 Tax=Paraherbaspirillum soli TaxID=631222 RepID=A0ABW0M586_9BURK